MKKTLVFLVSLFVCFNAHSQEEDVPEIIEKKSIPLTLYLAPILDGVSFAAEWRINKRLGLNVYGFKRKSDISTYYQTKAKENLGEIALKVYALNPDNRRFNLFFAPCFGFRNIIYDERTFFFDPVGGSGPQFSGTPDLRANANYFVPMYFGLDFVSKRGLVFEYAGGLCFLRSYGATNISGPVISPYKEPYNIRSRFLFGYQF